MRDLGPRARLLPRWRFGGKSLVVAASAILAVTGVVVPAYAIPATADRAPVTVTADRAPATGISWGACADPALHSAGAVCGFVTAPLDYDHPGGAKVRLAVDMIRHTTPDSQYQGVMLVNPGGPGGSGLRFALISQSVPNGAADAYDWIGFDPRGVGASTPALSCDPNYFGSNRPDYVATTPALVHTWLSRTASYAAACGADNEALLRHMSTVDSARDMDRIRVALGASEINFYGASYGTYLGQVYATLFPHRVRRMIMDGNVDPGTVWYRFFLTDDVAFDRDMKIWFGWLARYDSVYHLGHTERAVERLWYHERDALRGHPAGGIIGPDEFADAFQFPGYAQSVWTVSADAFASWVHHRDADPMIALYQAIDGPGDDNEFAVFSAVTCTDAPSPPDFATWRRDATRITSFAPYYAWLSLWFSAPCLYWPAPATRPVRVDGRGVAPVLLINETLDALTPYGGALEVRKRFPNARLLAEPGGTTHAGALTGNACVDDQIAAYLADGTLPPRLPGNRADLLCAPLPQPVPTAASNTNAPHAATVPGVGTLRLSNGRPLVPLGWPLMPLG